MCLYQLYQGRVEYVFVPSMEMLLVDEGAFIVSTLRKTNERQEKTRFIILAKQTLVTLSLFGVIDICELYLIDTITSRKLPLFLFWNCL